MAFPFAEASDAEMLAFVLDRIGVFLLGVLSETPAGVLLLVGLATLWVGWLTHKRQERD